MKLSLHPKLLASLRSPIDARFSKSFLSHRYYRTSAIVTMSKDKDLVRGFETICLHGGYLPDSTTSRGVPLYRTAPYVFPSTDRAAKLFALQELGNLYTRMMNPTTDILEKRFSLLEGAHELAGLAYSSGTAAIFNTIITLAENGDNIVSAQNLYGGTFTMFNDIIPKFGLKVKFVNILDLEVRQSRITLENACHCCVFAVFNT